MHDPVRTSGLKGREGLHVRDLSVTMGGRRIVRGVSFQAAGGELIGLIGPNGSGKTTLLRALAGLVPSEGTVDLLGTAVSEQSRRRLARSVAMMAQHPPVDFAFSAREVVALGRLPHLPLLGSPGERDARRVDSALERVGALGFAGQPLQTLSGGERRRVMLAQSLVQETPVLLLDEPTAHLDVAHQFALMEVARALAAEGHLVLAALHELPLAARFCSRLLVLDQGRCVADGPPPSVLTQALLAEVFGMDARVSRGPHELRIDYLRALPSPTPLRA